MKEKRKLFQRIKISNCTCADPEPVLESGIEACPVVVDAETFSIIPGMDKIIPRKSCDRCNGSIAQISYITKY